MGGVKEFFQLLTPWSLDVIFNIIKSQIEDASDDVINNYPRNIGNERQGRKLPKQIQIKE
jgi:hypothetical protein